MQELHHSLHAFINAIEQNQLILLTRQGQWEVKKTVFSWLLRSFNFSEQYQIKFLKNFICIVDDLESIPINFSHTPGVVVAQKVDFHGYLNAIQAIYRYFKNHTHSQIDLYLATLKIRAIGLLYRLEEENGGLRLTHPNIEQVELLTTLAKQWKAQHPLLWKKHLTEKEGKILNHIGVFKEFTQQLVTNQNLRIEFFNWALRDGLSPEIFIQFPALKQKIIACCLNGRIGRIGQHLLKLQKIDHQETTRCLQKCVMLPFEGHYISILAETKEIIFRSNYRITVKNIFEIFRNKQLDLGNFELFANGIQNWNSNCLGWWNQELKAFELIDIDQPNWWQELPVLEFLTVEQTSQRFGIQVEGKKWVVAAKSARESATMDFDGCHAYVEMAIPSADSLYYVIYTFGKAATQLPCNFWQRLFLFGAHVPATIVYPDETMYFTHRQQIGYSFELTQEEGQELMNAFREDILRARTGNIVFQIEAENCGKWLQTHLEEHLGVQRVPNLYRHSVLEAEPVGFMARFFNFFRALPNFCRVRLFILIHYPLGAWRGRWIVTKQGNKIWKSLLNSSFWQDAITYIPAYLHRQHEVGTFADESQKHVVWTEEFNLGQIEPDIEPRQPRLFEDNHKHPGL